MSSKEWKEIGAKGEELVAVIDKMKHFQEEGRYDLFKDSVDSFLESITGGIS
jgi:hypothetical protein